MNNIIGSDKIRAAIEKRTALITTSSFGEDNPRIFEMMSNRGLTVVMNPYARKLTGDELEMLLEKYRPSGLLAGTEPITSLIMSRAASFLKVISRVGVSVDNIDLEGAESLGIRVFRTAGVLGQAVAELTIGMMLAALRGVAIHDRLMRAGKWEKRMGSLLQGKTVGIIGFGDIGRSVGVLAKAFGATICYYDPQGGTAPEWAQMSSMADLLRESDIVSLHASGNDRILTINELRCCKKGVIIVNTARGGLIDERDLCRSLADGQVGFACLDVFEHEPYLGSLRQMENVLLTPHIGSYAREARREMEEAAVRNLCDGLKEVERYER